MQIESYIVCQKPTACRYLQQAVFVYQKIFIPSKIAFFGPQ